MVSHKRFVGVVGLLFGIYAALNPAAAKRLNTDNFARCVELSATGYSGATELTNFPVLVRLSTAVGNFAYTDFSAPATGGDLRFTDADGAELPFEIDTWDTNGTSLVWVRIPVLTNNAAFTAWYGNAAAAAAPDSTNVWAAYAGVWHLNELGGGGASADAAAYAIHGVNANCTTGMAGGVVGNCRRISDSAYDVQNEGGILVPGYPALKIATNVTISGWLRHKNQQANFDHIFYQRYSFARDSTGGFVSQTAGSAKGAAYGWNNVEYAGSETAALAGFGLPGAYTDYAWFHLAFVYSVSGCSVYTNGALAITATSGFTPVRIATNFLAFGTSSVGNSVSWKGEMDEIRVAPSVCSAEEVKAEYESVTNLSFVTAGAVINMTEPAFSISAATDITSSSATVPGALTRLGTHEGLIVSLVCTSAGGSPVTNLVGTYSAVTNLSQELTGLSLGTDYTCFFLAEAADGTVATSEAITFTTLGRLVLGTVTAATGTGSATFTVPVTSLGAATSASLAVYVGHTAASLKSVASLSSITATGDQTLTATKLNSGTWYYAVRAWFTDGATVYETWSETNSLTVAGAAVVYGYAQSFTVSFPSYSGTTLAGFPVLLRLSNGNPAGFSYDDFRGTGGSDLRFTDSNGAFLPMEIQKWDTSGTSLVWVRVPSLDASTTISGWYGNFDPDPVSGTVWSNYAGVWHLDETGTTAADASANGLDGTYTNVAATAVGDAVAGACCTVSAATSQDKSGRGILVPHSAALDVGATLTMSGWVRHNNSTWNYDRLVSHKTAYDEAAGWETELAASNKGWTFRFSCGSATAVTANDFSPCQTNWMHFALVADGTTGYIYTNGALAVSGSITAIADRTDCGLVFGNNAQFAESSFRGDLDEFRFAGAARSADWVNAAYQNQRTNSSFAVLGEVAATDATAPVFAGAPVLYWNGTERYYTATLAAGTGAVYAVINVAGNSYTNPLSVGAVVGPQTFSATIPDQYFAAGDVVCTYSVWATNTLGSYAFKAGTNAFLNGEVSIAAGTNADELVLTMPGTFIVSRPAGALATNYDLTVTYAVSGSAVAGSNYVALTGSVVIPAGAASATIEVYPLRTKDGDHAVTVTLTGDAYKISSTSNTASITIKTLTAPDGYNTWIAPGTGVADPAVATNWSKGTVPVTTDNIFVDGRFSQASMTWSSTMASTVASWTQSADYTGVVTIATMYPNVMGAMFTNFTIAGDCALLGGRFDHPLSYRVSTSQAWPTGAEIQSNEIYRLCLTISGAFTVGPSGMVFVATRGHYQNQNFDSTNHYPAYATHVLGRGDVCYGDPRRPIDIGTGCLIRNPSGWSASYGGGAAWIRAGTVVVDGVITADGSTDVNGGGGAAGSILIEAASVTGSGVIRAMGYTSSNSSGLSCGAGGRIALWTTNAVSLGAPVVNAGAYGNGNNACGTVFLHDSSSTYGTLMIDNKAATTATGVARVYSSTPVTTEGDWRFDKVVLGGVAHFELPVGATLHLPNGFASITNSASNTSARYTAFYYTGGTLDCASGAEVDHVMSGYYTLFSFTNNVFPGSLILRNGASIGTLPIVRVLANSADPATNDLYSCRLAVAGNLTIESTAAGIQAYHSGVRQESGGLCPGYAFGGHGGAIGTNRIGKTSTVYDSIFTPFLPGIYQNNSYDQPGGGVVHLAVGGALTLNADAVSDGCETWNNAFASGGPGTLDITCGSLAGTAKIHANGLATSAGAGGGRVAVRLTQAGATFDAFGVTNITARQSGAASAGTVYLQTADEGELAGTIRINGNGAFYKVGTVTNNYATPVPGVGAYVDDAASFVNAKLDVSNYGEAQFTTNLTVKTIAVDATSKLDLLGKAVKVNILTLGGKKVAAGVYHAADAAVSDYVLDSAGSDGTITVCKFGGFYIIVQ